ncbi:NmrA family NAD(P)-binding protein, partial [Rhizobium leguminosarum]|uniref:NmrA family NAD(P)-binding protein n=1 Tax=Rhizobium leguminosarum TaxID=384 RepID=UPI003F95B8F1
AAAAEGVDAMFLIGNSYEAGTDAETRQGIAASDAAKAAGIGHLIYSSVADADKKTGIPHFDSKYLVDRPGSHGVLHEGDGCADRVRDAEDCNVLLEE